MKSLLAILLTLLLFIIPIQVHATQDIQGKVMKVKDGDTVVIAPIESEYFITCRLYGIDAPENNKRGEPGQPFGEEATKELKHMILSKNVQAVTAEKDRYNRDICFIILNGLDVNLEMVKMGYAWAFVRYLQKPYIGKYVAAETEAKKAGLGLWKDKDPEPPWDYRKRMKERNN